MPYGKIKDNDIEYAPINMGNIINFNSNVELMLSYGYKLVNTDGIEPEYDNRYQRIELIWKENDEEIYKSFKIVDYRTYEEALKDFKENKYKEALNGAKSYIENEGCYKFTETDSIEINDGNIAKLSAYTIAMQQGLYETITWVSKEDNILELNLEDIMNILQGIAKEQTNIWVEKYPKYLKMIEKATTLDEIENICIDYNVNIK